MKTERKLKQYYLLRDTAWFLLWSPVVAAGLVLTIGFHVYDRPRMVSRELEALFDATQYTVLASPAGMLVGLIALWVSRRSAAAWQGGELPIAVDGAIRVSRLGEYKLKRLRSHREAGLRLTRFQLIKPLRVTFNSVVTGFILMMAFTQPAYVNSPGGPRATGHLSEYMIATGILIIGLAGATLWVNRGWVCEVVVAHGGCRIQKTTRSGFFRLRAFHPRVLRGFPNVRAAGKAVIINDDERQLCFEKLSPGKLGEWEAIQLAEVIREAAGAAIGSRR